MQTQGIVNEITKNTRCEYGPGFDLPPIPLYPAKSLLEKKSVTFNLVLNPDKATTDKTNIIERKVNYLSAATPEDFLSWEQDLQAILSSTSKNSASSKFDVVESLLLPNALLNWRTCKNTGMEVAKEAYVTSSSSPETTQEKEDSISTNAFTYTWRAFKKLFFPKSYSAVQAQKDYMRSHIFKPTILSVDAFYQRIQIMNDYIPRFPDACGNDKLSDADLVSILFQAVHSSYRSTFRQNGKSTSNYTLQTLKEYFEIIEVEDAIRNKSLKEQGKNDNNPPYNKSSNNNYRRKRKRNYNTSSSEQPQNTTSNTSISNSKPKQGCQFCMHLSKYKGKSHTHTTDQCGILKRVEQNGSTSINSQNKSTGGV